MADFVCKVGTPGGQILEETYSSASEDQLRADFDAKDYLVFSIRKKVMGASLLKPSSFKRNKVGAKEFLVFNQELASLITAGLPIVASLNILLERRKNPAFRAALVDIRDQVKSGAALSDAFASHGDLFPRLYAPALSSGERSGEVASVLKRYVEYTKTMLTMKQKITAALTYPIILVCVSVGLVLFLVTYVLPAFEGFFDQLGADMPLLTKIVIGITGFMSRYILIIIPAIAGLVIAVVSWKRTEAGAVWFDHFKMKLPLIGALTTKWAVSSFCRTLGTLVKGGIPLVNALEISARAIASRVFSAGLMTVATQVREGQPLWLSLENTGIMSDMAVEMIKVGESTGSLEEMLVNISSFYDDEIEADLARIVSLMEPVLLIFMGLTVATIIMAFYLPLLTSFATTNG